MKWFKDLNKCYNSEECIDDSKNWNKYKVLKEHGKWICLEAVESRCGGISYEYTSMAVYTQESSSSKKCIAKAEKLIGIRKQNKLMEEMNK